MPPVEQSDSMMEVKRDEIADPESSTRSNSDEVEVYKKGADTAGKNEECRISLSKDQAEKVSEPDAPALVQ